jgi:formiminoglutamate deiminase
MVSLWFQSALLFEGWSNQVRITFDENAIQSIETGTAPKAGDERCGIALPGLANVHSHAFQRGMAGLAEVRGPAHDNFWTWREVMYHFLDRLTPEDIEAITALAYIEMLETGFTRVGEFHYLHHDAAGTPYSNVAELGERIVSAAHATGISLTLLPVFYAHGNFGGRPPVPGQRRFLNDPSRFAKLVEQSRKAISSLPNANLGIAPHSLRAVTPEELKEILPLANGGPIQIHAAEQTEEVDDCLEWSKQRPVEWLLNNAGVDKRWCLVHSTHMTEEETTRLADSGAIAGLCPITESNLGDGIFPAPDYLLAKGRFGIGTDSNILIDAAQELRTMEYAQRLSLRARNVLAPEAGRSTGRSLFDSALTGGFQALGIAIYGITEGAPSDIVVLDADDPGFAGRSGDTILDSWLFARGTLDSVWKQGIKVVSRGRHHSRDAIMRRYKETLSRILS